MSLLYRLRIPIIAGVLSLFILGVCTAFLASAETDHGTLKVTFLDIGQGDATFIESPSGTQVLIDGGKGSQILGALDSVMGFFDRDIDMIVATHPDMDHIGGLIDVLERYKVTTILMTENENDTPAYETFKKRIAEEGAQILIARRGQIYDLGRGASGSTTLTILFPDRDPTHLESNLSSIVAQLAYGESEYLLTGDSPQEIEEYLVMLASSTLESDVLKAGHHGSRTSTGEVFVSAVRPEYAIISAGKDNSYGHPHKEVTELLSQKGIEQKSTADLGSIFSVSDGKTVFFKN